MHFELQNETLQKPIEKIRKFVLFEFGKHKDMTNEIYCCKSIGIDGGIAVGICLSLMIVLMTIEAG